MLLLEIRKVLLPSALICFLHGTALASVVTLINDSSLGNYNSSLGNVLDGTSELFPITNTVDPTFDPAPEPALLTAEVILGHWLTDPSNLNQNWSSAQAIPTTWASGTESAIVYTIAVAGQLKDFSVSIGVDNGAFVWLDGHYLGGQVKPGVVFPGELKLTVPNIDQGTHYLQILREDHGSLIGFSIAATATAVPEPSAVAILVAIPPLFCMARTQRHN